MISRLLDRFVSETTSLRWNTWCNRWFPYRTYEWEPGKSLGPARWQWPDVLGRPFR